MFKFTPETSTTEKLHKQVYITQQTPCSARFPSRSDVNWPSNDLCTARLAKEEELKGALTKAEDLEKENLDLMTKLSEKEQECDVRTQERDDLNASLSRLQEKFETESMGTFLCAASVGQTGT